MKNFLQFFSENIKQAEDEIKTLIGSVKEKIECNIYTSSLNKAGDCWVMIASSGNSKFLFAVSEKKNSVIANFAGKSFGKNRIFAKKCHLSDKNAVQIRKFFPWTAPISLAKRKTTIGCGDRLGRATPGQIAAFRKFNASPVLAQQSMRELSLTNRTYTNVVDDVTFLVFQEGFKDGFGGDGDHLKKISDINSAIDAGMTMITLDLSDLMKAEAALWSETQINENFASLPHQTQERIKGTYFNRTVQAGRVSFIINPLEAKRAAVMFLDAMDFAAEVAKHLKRRKGKECDLEISIDETSCPTLPQDHFFIVNELAFRKVDFMSIAPRFIGEFQKGIDYIGDIGQFKEQFFKHREIAKAYGNYKISVHSGSDKFSIFPIVGELTEGRFHLKTAGTSWLEAVRVIALKNPPLYRKIHQCALASFADAKKLYHVTSDIKKIHRLEDLADTELPEYLNFNESRQLLHISYGGILADEKLKKDFFDSLHVNEKSYIDILDRHFTKHLSALGVSRRTN
jgi:hypothetical protein